MSFFSGNLDKIFKEKKTTELRCIIQNDPVNQNSNIYEDEKIESNSKAYDTYGLKAFDIHMSERIKKEQIHGFQMVAIEKNRSMCIVHPYI